MIGVIFGAATTLDAIAAGVDPSDAFLSGVVSGLSAGAFAGTGNVLDSKMSGSFAGGLTKEGFVIKIFAHGAIGGITSVLQGSKFGHGFASAFASAAATSFNNRQFVDRGNQRFSRKRVAVGAAIGGTASKLSGGKFANGAATGAFSHALNYENELFPEKIFGMPNQYSESINQEINRQQFEEVLDVTLRVGAQDSIPGVVTISGTTDGDNLAWSLTLDGKVAAAGVIVDTDGEVTVSVSRSFVKLPELKGQSVLGLSVGGSASNFGTLGGFVKGNVWKFQLNAGAKVKAPSMFENLKKGIESIGTGIENVYK